MANGNRNTPPGPSVDASGQSTIDPSKNVEALVEASNKHQHDMRRAESEIRRAESRHIRELMKKDARHVRELMKAESKRIDATRQVDVQAVESARQVQATAASTLQSQVSDTSEAFRQGQEAQRQATDQRLVAALDPIQKDVIALRETQWTGRGKEATVEKRGVSIGVWVGLGIAALFGLLSFLVSLGGLIIALNR